MKLKATDTNSIVPVPRMLGALALGGLVAVLVIPAVATRFSDSAEPTLGVMLATWLAMIAITGAYLFPMSVVLGFRRDWFRYGLLCLAGLYLILFVLLPLSARGQADLGLSGFVLVSFASLLLSLVVFGQICKGARRYLPPQQWPVKAKVALALIAATAGLTARLVVSAVLGMDAVASVRSEEGLLLGLASALAGLSLAHALDLSTRPPLVSVEGRSLIGRTVRIGVGLLVVLHLQWLLYLTRIL